MVLYQFLMEILYEIDMELNIMDATETKQTCCIGL